MEFPNYYKIVIQVIENNLIYLLFLSNIFEFLRFKSCYNE